MRILIHCNEYYPNPVAGSYRMQVFAETFKALGNDVIVLTSSANKAAGTFDKEARKEKVVYSPAVSMRRKTTLKRLLNNISFGFTSIFTSLFVGKVDVVITTSPPALASIPGWFIAKFKRAKLVYDVRDIWPEVALEMGSFSERSFYCRVFRRITGFMYKHADVITTVSPGKFEKIKNHVIARPGRKSGPEHVDKIWLVSNGFDEGLLNSEFDQAIVDKYGLDKKFTCVYIGNIGLAQGLGTLLNLAAKTKHRDIQFLCFGMGAEREMLEKRVEDEGLTNIKFCGPIGRNKVFSVLSHAKISFVPLKNRNMTDSVPTKVYEGLGIGCPVFLVAEGDSAALIDETGLGRHVPPEELEKQVEVFDDMVDRYGELVPLKDKTARLVDDKYSRQKIAAEFEKKLRELCGK
ncbi:MAG: glycosyltransferase family 4 protein [Thermoguttaceae bacterium]|nr:glycosyltransferase family 4 protein [Thermoguttaceae bacterium]